MNSAAGFSPVQLTLAHLLSRRTLFLLCKTAQSYLKQAPALSRKAQTTPTSPKVGEKQLSEHNSKGLTAQPAKKHSNCPTLALISRSKRSLGKLLPSFLWWKEAAGQSPARNTVLVGPWVTDACWASRGLLEENQRMPGPAAAPEDHGMGWQHCWG